MRVRLEKDGVVVALDAQPIARGGEAAIYPAPDRPGLLAKVYHKPTTEQGDKLAAMIANPPADPTTTQGHTSIAWPVQRLLAEDAGRCVGFLMPRVDKVQSLFDVYNPKSRLQTWPLFHYGYLLRTARNLSAAVRALHVRGYVLGDLNESNVLVNGQTLVTVVDTDSFQTRTPDRVFRCTVGKPEYVAPEIQNARFADIDRTPEHDYFALAVLIFQLLMQGSHPFAGRFTGEGEPETLAKRIAAGHWPYARARRGPFEPNPTAPPFEMLPPQVRELMRQCFEDGHDRPSIRPDAGCWHKALAVADAELVECVANSQHRFHQDQDSCPWCELTPKQGRDPFPSKEAVQIRANGAAKTAATAATTKTRPIAVAPASPSLPAASVKAPRGRPAGRRHAAGLLAPALTPWPWVIGVGLAALGVLVWLIAANAHRPAAPPVAVVKPADDDATPAPIADPMELFVRLPQDGIPKVPPPPLADKGKPTTEKNPPPMRTGTDQPKEIANSIGMKLVLIPAGKFLMGSPKDEEGRYGDEGAPHEVEITKAFYMGVYPVTKAQFASFVRDDHYWTEAEAANFAENTWRNPTWFLGSKYDQTDDDPVVFVSWNDAVKFCEWLSRKEGKTCELPTEAEWEYACRAGTTTAFSFPDPKDLDDYTWYSDYSGYHTHPVGGKKPNPWGLHDMHGNVWQWCADGYGPYDIKDIRDPKGKKNINSFVVRGGSWCLEPRGYRSANRYHFDPAHRGAGVGFRVVSRPPAGTR